MSCNACISYESRENTIGRTSKRLVKALWNRARGRAVVNNPRIHCHVCDIIVPPENVVLLPPNIQDANGATDETFLGAVYGVTCHGQTDNVYVTLVSQLVGNASCCRTAFRPSWNSEWSKRFQSELEEDVKAASRRPEVAKAKVSLQAEIAEANARRSDFLKRTDLLAKVRELEALVSNLSGFESPGVMKESTADALEEDISKARAIALPEVDRSCCHSDVGTPCPHPVGT